MLALSGKPIPMLFSTEQHLAAAKLIRRNGANASSAKREHFVRMSNNFIVCARLAARDRGGISLEGFDWSSVYPDWDAIETQIKQLLPQKNGITLDSSGQLMELVARCNDLIIPAESFSSRPQSNCSARGVACSGIACGTAQALPVALLRLCLWHRSSMLQAS